MVFTSGARDDYGDGIREVHTNTIEGMWAGLRTFLRPFRGVSKHFLSGYVAIHEFAVNLKRISIHFIAALVRLHSFYRIQQPFQEAALLCGGV